MRLDRIGTIFFASTLAGLAVTPAFATSRYDGQWHVTIVTKTGSCEHTASSTLMITNGKISAADADITGRITPAGLVRVSINGAYANGQLSGNAGWGKWNGASAGIPCSGRWQASRQ